VTVPIASDAVVIDSSGWLEYITADEEADRFAPYFEGGMKIIVPVIVLYEVWKVLLRRQSETLANVFVSEALRREVVAIDENIALTASTLSVRYTLHMADALLYATAQSRGALFVSLDGHFANLPGVTLV